MLPRTQSNGDSQWSVTHGVCRKSCCLILNSNSFTDISHHRSRLGAKLNPYVVHLHRYHDENNPFLQLDFLYVDIVELD